MKPRWSVSAEILAVFNRCTAAERRRLVDLFEQIAEFPANFTDYVDRGPKGRQYSVAQVRKWIVTYWIDPDGSEVRFVQLEFVV